VPATTRDQLIQLRQDLRTRLERVERDLKRANEELSADAPDRAIQLQNDEVLQALGTSTRLELEEVDRALQRLALGLQGVCETCGGEIPQARLEAIPHTTQCARCAA
jgi:RNA polymerase-binding transcription factor DksA